MRDIFSIRCIYSILAPRNIVAHFIKYTPSLACAFLVLLNLAILLFPTYIGRITPRNFLADAVFSSPPFIYDNKSLSPIRNHTAKSLYYT